MARYDSKRIDEVVKMIEDGEMLLPALQRNYVWTESKICDLFESLMHDYPIGTFLFWTLDKSEMDKYVFNTFIKKYSEKLGKNNQRGERIKEFTRDKYTGVLDGQQRITSLYLGVRGSVSTKIPKRPLSDPNAYEDRYLCINILHDPEVKQDTEHVFAFKLADEMNTLKKDSAGTRYFWKKVGDIFSLGKGTSISKICRDIERDNIKENWPFEERERAEINLERLQALLFKNECVNFYSSFDTNLESVVDIFVKVNSGGENLQAADLMLSVSALHSPDNDIHSLFLDAVNSLNAQLGTTSFIDNNFLLRAGLMFTGADSVSLSAAESYSVSRTKQIYENWDQIYASLVYTIRFLSYAGIDVAKIPKNIYLSVAYYFYRKQNLIKDGYEKSTKLQIVKDRILIRQFVLRGVFTGLFDSSTGSVLLSVRSSISNAIDDKKEYFPLDTLMHGEKLDEEKLVISEDFINRIMGLSYGDARINPLLRELSGDRSVSPVDVDHIWPKSIMESKAKFLKVFPNKTIDDYNAYKGERHKLTNLELLTPADNESKGDSLFDEWALKNKHDDSFYQQHLIPRKADNTNYSFDEFFEFLNKRDELMREAIKKAFPSTFKEIIEKYKF